ncbi:MAG: PTS glucose transporter subunit IIA [Lachnospiraceae bacterium]|nr:PTS glucose transporter subunit IIA [Lachnospiraceae bacterium]
MGLLRNLFGDNNKIEIGSPASGELIPIEEVSDPTFAEEMLGRGVALIPDDGRFYAPADGILESLFPTGHAFSVVTKDGTEILVHIGFDTVKLNGEHFTLHATQGQDVLKGDLIVEVDLEALKAAGYDVTTPMIILNSDAYSDFSKKSGSVEAGDPALILTKA